nr:UDP-4-amino-4,6-dideoxy-N-acetyl-beta-L-altrosamine N-acetyltransferase [uncultured Dongia sp.]
MITLRPVEPGDSEKLFRWRNLPEIAKNMHTDHEISQEEHDAWFASAITNKTRKYWIIKRNDIDIGLVNIYDISPENGRCYWAIYIGEMVERGVGTGAFVEVLLLDHVFLDLGFHNLCCEVLTDNERGVRQHVKYGFVVEGVLREHIFKDNRYFDVSCLGLLRQEWLDRRFAIIKKLVDRGHSYLARPSDLEALRS